MSNARPANALTDGADENGAGLARSTVNLFLLLAQDQLIVGR
jgi:hypothetical protein